MTQPILFIPLHINDNLNYHNHNYHNKKWYYVCR